MMSKITSEFLVELMHRQYVRQLADDHKHVHYVNVRLFGLQLHVMSSVRSCLCAHTRYLTRDNT